jgi:hypothetical protein
MAAGCSNERDAAPAPGAGRAGNDIAPFEKHATGGQDALRVKTDTARGRLWVLGLDAVRVHDAASGKPIRQVTLPNWSVARFICDPDMVLDSSGSAIISSNAQAKLWRIDADSFQVKEQEISLLGRERWDIGFGALAFATDGTLYAMTATAGSLWKIDAARAGASLVETYLPPSKACAITAQFLGRPDRSRKP